MKNFKLLLVLLSFTVLVGCGYISSVPTNNNTKVYICTGEYSYCFHRTKHCKGLSNCGGKIKKVSLSKAKSMNRSKPCGFCYKKEK